MSTYLGYLEKICSVYNSVSAILAAVDLILTGVSFVLHKTPATTGGGGAIQIGKWLGEKAYEAGGKIIVYGCGFMECNLWSKILTGKPNNSPDTGLIDLIIFALTGVSPSNALAGLRSSLVGSYYEISKKSMMYSIVFLCLPGVIYNLKQARNIDCQYVYCLENEVVEGQQPYVCQARRGYNECMLVYGQVFNSMPFSIFLSMISSFMKLFSQNPASAVSVSIGIACMPIWGFPIKDNICIVNGHINTVIGGITAAMSIADMFSGDDATPVDYCEEIDL
jgi:hypothetical protein